MLRLFELVGECSYAMESDTVPGARSAPYGEIESGWGDHPQARARGEGIRAFSAVG